MMQINYKKQRTTNLYNKGDVYFLKYKALEEISSINHGFSTRLGGVSEGIFSAMNLSFTRGDDEEKVLKNFELISDAIGFDYKKVVYSKQTHTTNVLKVDSSFAGEGIIKPQSFSDIDGFVTNDPGVVLTTSFADCVPLFFVDPVKKCIGLSHSGWRGTAYKIGEVTIKKMTEEYGSNPADIVAAIGPSICGDCYEVSEDVYFEFKKSFKEDELKQIFSDSYIRENEVKFKLDLWKANEIIMINAGVKKENISLPDLCTCENDKLLFSHRASNGKRGNVNAFLMLK